ncbi:MAG: DUF480 domain-containing protein [Planctomycetota bacterium]
MTSSESTGAERKWTQLNRLQRRVLGVLVEKSKTTPETYPMTLNSLTNGCNQKNNRSPLMNLSQDEVLKTLDSLRGLGVVTEVHGDGRVPKYKHQMYDWMGIDRPESAVMTELLLRGQQTLGELRARAARMEPAIEELTQLKPIIDALMAKGLMMELTPPGRGQVVSHALYQPEELAKVRAQVEQEKGAGVSGAEAESEDEPRAAGSVLKANAELGNLAERLERIEAAIKRIEERLAILES